MNSVGTRTSSVAAFIAGVAHVLGIMALMRKVVVCSSLLVLQEHNCRLFPQTSITIMAKRMPRRNMVIVY